MVSYLSEANTNSHLLQQMLEREEQFQKWVNAIEFILERNKELIDTIEETFIQLSDLKDTCSMLTNEVENLRIVIKKKEKNEDQMKEYLEDYESQISEFKIEIKLKDDIISKLKQGNLARIEELHMKEAEHDDFDSEELDFSNNQFLIKEKMTTMYFDKQEENENLKNDLYNANNRMTEIKQQIKQDQERYDDVFEELKILKSHFYALEREKGISDQKVKNLLFKNDNLLKDISLYKKNCDEMESTIENIEK